MRSGFISIAVLCFTILLVLALSACGATSAQQKAQQANNNLQNQVYQSRHNVEFRNYNWRQEISDDPATILWCTFFPLDHAPFTVPIAGKLTSSDKRPYDNVDDNGNNVPGPDHMFGSSVPYRYGFGPLGKADYTDFTDLSSICTTIPKVWQDQTNIIAKTSTTLQSVSAAASAAIKAGNAKKAEAILAGADGGGK